MQIIQNQLQHQTHFKDYKNKNSTKEGKITHSDSQKKETMDHFNKFTFQFLKLSIMWNVLYFLYQITIFAKEKEKSTALDFSKGLFFTYIVLFSVWYVLDAGKNLKVEISTLTTFSYITIYIHILGITFLSFFFKERIEDNAVNMVKRFPYDWYLILSGFLMFLSSEAKSIDKHKLLIIFYFISSNGVIISMGFIKRDFENLGMLLIMCVVLYSILLNCKKQENFIDYKLEENYIMAEKTFGHLQNVTKSLNAGIFLFKNEELFFCNEISRSLLESSSNMPLNEMNPHEQKNTLEDSETKPNNLKENNKLPSSNQTDIKSMFSNLHIHEDSSNLQEIFSKCKTDCSYHKSFFKNALILEDNNKEQSSLNLYSIFKLLINSCSLSNPESNCDCVRLSHFNGYVSLGIFNLVSGEGTKKFFEIITKIENSSTGEKEIEFIFKDVTSHYDLLGKIDEINLNFKKNAHEFKTPILSLLGCTEELKSQLETIDYLLPEMQKNNINDYLDHVTNLSSYIGYLIKGLTKSNKETNEKSNSISEHKEIKLNSLLSFCLKILKSLLGCDSQKLKNVKTELKNDVLDYDVTFISDEIKVKQILLNFISNSVKFTNYGRIEMKAKTKKNNQNDILMIIIKDTGCGVKKEDSLKLFNEYSKFNNTQNNAFGTGLGLNICKSMADNLNMKIEFESEENKGTKVILSIFNPVIKEDKFLGFKKTWSMTTIPIRSKDNFFKITSAEFGKRSQTLIFQEGEITLEDGNISKVLIKKTTLINSSSSGSKFKVNEERQAFNSNFNMLGRDENNRLIEPVESEFNYSLISCLPSHSSEISDSNIYNEKSTRRLSQDHDYGINHSEKQLTQYIPESVIKRHPLGQLKTQDNQILSLDQLCDPIVKKITLLNNFVPCNLNEINIKNSELSLILEKNTTVKSKKSLFTAEKILVVDDQLHARKALANVIKKYTKEKNLNFDIIEECDGIECLKTIITFPSNIRYVFTDENMNYMNGTETAGIIRRLQNAGKIPKINLILTTADDNLSLRKNLFDFCITKPVKKDNIAEIFNFDIN